METALTESEQALRKDLEGIICKGKQTFLDVGGALVKMRNLRLYRDTHGTFEAYCEDVHQFSRTYAHRLIQAAEVAEMLPIGNKPATESQARELSKVKPEQRAEVMEAAKKIAQDENRPVRAKDIAAVSLPTIRESVAAKDATTQAPVAPSHSLKSFYAEAEGLADVVLAEFNVTDLSHAAGHFEMLAAKIKRAVRERKSA